EEDLARRDFTVNAMALCLSNDDRITSNSSRIRSFEKHSRKDIRDALERHKLIDPFNGQADLKNKLIRAVGNAEERFSEDALRMLRAVRLATELGFTIELKTKEAIIKNSGWIQAISKERIRDEFSKILMTGSAWDGIELLHEVGLLKHIVPELEEGIGCGQNKHHVYPVWEHNLRSLDYAAKHDWPLAVRIGALLHDVAKPHTKQGEGPDSTFYGHDVVGAKMTAQILSRLRYGDDFIQKIVKLVRWHLFRYDYEVDEVQTTDSSIRRLIRNVGVENIEDLVKVRMCDRVGSGVPKAVPYRLRHFQFRVEKILREHEAVKVTMLKVGGEDVMKILGIAPGPKVGHVLNALLEEVLDDPKKNQREYLEGRAAELGGLSDSELVELREKAESRVELLEGQREEEIKKKYWVK
ncbi:HD domain-containing protein, partial [Candidatus Wolfebacteria bacterium]|nr:HD domain-containing protein [Candidatus Wolfebacteria bacterium]